jgi:hypothetical protein
MNRMGAIRILGQCLPRVRRNPKVYTNKHIFDLRKSIVLVGIRRKRAWNSALTSRTPNGTGNPS